MKKALSGEEILSVSDSNYIEYYYPVVAENDCLKCHTNAKNSDILFSEKGHGKEKNHGYESPESAVCHGICLAGPGKPLSGDTLSFVFIF